jgi:hypothetical protein
MNDRCRGAGLAAALATSTAWLVAGCNGGAATDEESAALSEIRQLRARLTSLESRVRGQTKKVDEMARRIAARERAAREAATVTKPPAAPASPPRRPEERERAERPAAPSRILFDEFALRVQKALKAAGYDPGPVDGKKGPLTTKALKEFQKANGLAETGMADPDTWVILKRELE